MKLTIIEKADLMRLKKIVSDGERSFITVGDALLEIRDKKLYREESLTFEMFCRKTWGWAANYGRRLIAAAEVVKTVPIGTIKTETQARELVKVEPAKRAEVMKAVSASGPVTAKAIARVAAAASAAPIDVDKIGRPIPHKAMPFWKRRDEIQAILTKMSAIKSVLQHAQDNKDLMFIEVNFSAAINYLENSRGNVKRAMPYCVCPTCQGKLVEKCCVCGGRGVISECLYQRVDEETKRALARKVSK